MYDAGLDIGDIKEITIELMVIHMRREQLQVGDIIKNIMMLVLICLDTVSDRNMIIFIRFVIRYIVAME